MLLCVGVFCPCYLLTRPFYHFDNDFCPVAGATYTISHTQLASADIGIRIRRSVIQIRVENARIRAIIPITA